MLKITKQPQQLNPADLVDQYATLNAEKAEIEAKLDALKLQIQATGFTELIGTLHRIKVSIIPGRKTFDLKAAIAAKVLSQSKADKFMKESAPYPRIGVFGL